MSENDWRQGLAKSLGVFLNGQGIPTSNNRGERVVDDSFYVLFNPHSEAIEFVVPNGAWGQRWSVVLDTAELAPPDDRATLASPMGTFREQLLLQDPLGLLPVFTERLLGRKGIVRCSRTARRSDLGRGVKQ